MHLPSKGALTSDQIALGSPGTSRQRDLDADFEPPARGPCRIRVCVCDCADLDYQQRMCRFRERGLSRRLATPIGLSSRTMMPCGRGWSTGASGWIAAHGNTPRGLDPADTKSAGVLHLASELRVGTMESVEREPTTVRDSERDACRCGAKRGTSQGGLSTITASGSGSRFHVRGAGHGEPAWRAGHQQKGDELRRA